MRKWAVACAWTLAVASAIGAKADAQQRPSRPNVLWITCEDISPSLRCFGDDYAVTPNLDRLASQGVRYTKAYAPIGVCAPSRSSLITGVYAPSIGTHHMRCSGSLPDYIKCFPEYLRDAGYYCTNNVKTDYNFKFRKESWDESSNRAHWRNRKSGQPFFSVFNFVTSHESQIRLPEAQYQKRTADFTSAERHDPAKAPIPPYHPDMPEVRQDWARYYDIITYMDKQAGEILKQLDEDGLADNTIVFFFSDHGAGMPRSKRWLYETSTHVPLIIRFPKAYEALAPGKPGSTTDRLVTFVDFGPTVLNLAGVPVPTHMQGKPFLGKEAAEPRKYVYGFRDRMDERYDMLRSVFDGRYRYIRNFMPQLPWFHEQYISYGYEMPTMRVWQRLADEGKLSGPQAIFMARSKPMEELYDVASDPFELNNLANAPEHQARLKQLRGALRDWMIDIRDLGLLPEADLRTRFGSVPPYEAVRRDPEKYPLEHILDAADVANRRDPHEIPQLTSLLKDDDPAARYWAAIGLGSLGERGSSAAGPLKEALADPAHWVSLAAADALARVGRLDLAMPALIQGLKDDNPWVRLQAILSLDRLDEQARPALAAMEQALKDSNEYVVRVAEHAIEPFHRPGAASGR